MDIKKDVSARFIEAFNYLKDNGFVSGQKDFAEIIKVSSSFITEVKNGRSSVGIPAIQNLVKEFPISLEWLFTGEGGITKHEKPAPPKVIPTERNKGIPFIPVGACAGTLTDELTAMADDCEYFFVPAFKDADFLIEVDGDSMLPRFHSGDIVACKWIGQLDFTYGRIYVFDTNKGSVIKQAMRSAEEGYINLVSINPEYKTIHLHMEDIYRVALVIGTIRPEAIK